MIQVDDREAIRRAYFVEHKSIGLLRVSCSTDDT
jgi:hypothetical protein